MRGFTRFAIAAVGLALLFAVGASASDETPKVAPLHGGVVNATQSYVFETVVSNDGLRVYLYTKAKTPAMVDKATGKAMLKLPGGKSMEVNLVHEVPDTTDAVVYFCPMHPEVVQDMPGKCDLCRGMVLYEQDRLFAKADLSGLKPEDLSAMIRVSGLRGREKEATFTPAFRMPDRKAN